MTETKIPKKTKAALDRCFSKATARIRGSPLERDLARISESKGVTMKEATWRAVNNPRILSPASRRAVKEAMSKFSSCTKRIPMKGRG